ncbi:MULTISPECIES: hypothetical protein [unclassified Mycoplasma]|uniref:hypothetical protein n=1 Tax=unclassified Mycoplasma TaxID=2683645 RepID=UPI00211CF152|nr:MULTISPECIES: hypothetical protein [unclassified Mycoplasma]UUM19602.1 hypothetical protein NPA11_02390 [Mycoplasma sp. 1578d]UUM24522.1 hypothetical protein NPA12_02370 [Mycoplasma sp. 3686d]
MYIQLSQIDLQTRVIFLIISMVALLSSFLVLWKDAYFYARNIALKNIYLREKTKYVYYWLFLSGLFSPLYYFFVHKNIIVNLELGNAYYLKEKDQFINLTGVSKYRVKKISSFKEFFKLDIIDIAISGLLLGLYLIVNTTIGRAGLTFEFLFYIVVSYFLRYFKAALVGVLADVLGLLISGNIAQWHWAYGVVPIISTFIMSMFFDLFEKNKKIAVILSNVFLWMVLASMFFVFWWQISAQKIDSIKISPTFGFKQISITTFVVMAIFSTIIAGIMSYLSFKYLFTKKETLAKNNLLIVLMSFASVVIIIVIFRWIWGPFAYIRWRTWLSPKSKLTLQKSYVIIMLPILFRSVISIPIYTLVLASLMIPLLHLRKKYIEKKIIGKY